MLVVTTKKELREARRNKTKSFVIRGELAKELLAAEQKRSNKKNTKNLKDYVGDFKVENMKGQQAVVATTTVALVLGIVAISSITVVVLYALKKDYNVKVRVKAKVKPTNGKGDVEVEPEVELECERR